jgi:hypothetical protein
MERPVKPTYVFIRDGMIMARLSPDTRGDGMPSKADFFDVRTGVQLREIHPPLSKRDLERAVELSEEYALSLMSESSDVEPQGEVFFDKVVSLVEIKQRKLDSIVADSIIDQLSRIKDVLQSFLNAAAQAQDDERFWLSQQVLPLLGKFSGRELAELEELAEWFRTRPKKK